MLVCGGIARALSARLARSTQDAHARNHERAALAGDCSERRPWHRARLTPRRRGRLPRRGRANAAACGGRARRTTDCRAVAAASREPRSKPRWHSPASWISGAVFQHQINLRLPQAPASLGQVAGLYRAASHTVQALFFTLGASVDLADDRGRTPLMLAACSPNSELVAALLEVHASPH